MQISDLIRKLQAEYDRQGDQEVILYTLEPEAQFRPVNVEFNYDGDEPAVVIDGEPIK